MNSFSDLFEIYVHVVVIDFLRYFIPASTAFLLCWVLLKKNLQHKFIQKHWPKTKRLWYEFKFSVSTVLIFALVGTGIVTAKNHGYTQLYSEVSGTGWIYLVVSLVFMVMFHDMYFYWTHRWMHHPRIYKLVHKVHHQSTNPSPWAAYSFHPLEAIIQALVFPILIFSIPVHSWVAFTFLLYMILRNVWGHLGYELLPAKFIESKWLNWNTTTTHHNLHHEKFNANYGLYFTWWDRWFGTEHGEYEQQFHKVTSRKKNAGKAACFTFLLFFATITYGQSPVGQWMTFDERTRQPLSIISIQQNPQLNTYEGTIDSIIVAPHLAEKGLCTLCPDDKKDQPIIGLEMVWGSKLSDGEWKGGKILDPESGNVYNCKIWFEDSEHILVRGYAGPFDLFYRTQKWRRMHGGEGIEGVWEAIDDRFDQPRAHIVLKIENNELHGYVRKIMLLPHEGNYPICLACKDDLKNQNIVGMIIMQGFKSEGKSWSDGTILDPGNGTTYSANFWLTDENTLKIRGYWGPFFRTQEWKRVGDF